MITNVQVNSITDIYAAFGTTKFLPDWDDIPAEFKAGSTPYNKLFNSLFYGLPLPEGKIEFHSDDLDEEKLHRFLRAHMWSFEPKHEHKEAGVAYLMSQIFTFELTAEPTTESK